MTLHIWKRKGKDPLEFVILKELVDYHSNDDQMDYIRVLEIGFPISQTNGSTINAALLDIPPKRFVKRRRSLGQKMTKTTWAKVRSTVMHKWTWSEEQMIVAGLQLAKVEREGDIELAKDSIKCARKDMRRIDKMIASVENGEDIAVGHEMTDGFMDL